MSFRSLIQGLPSRHPAVSPLLSTEVADALVTYLELLAVWNKRMNLTGFDLDVPTEAAIDRLVLEPLLAAAAVQATRMVDIGSGAGSPAIPLVLVLKPASAVLIEARSRKTVFLKEVVRALGLGQTVEIVPTRFEELASRPGFQSSFDLLTLRAVRVEKTTMSTLLDLLVKGGRILIFGSGLPQAPDALPIEQVIPLGKESSSGFVIRKP